MHVILHSFTYPLKSLTQAFISRQPIPILRATHNNISIQVSHTRNLSPPSFHPGVSHPKSFCAAISIQVSHTRNPSVPPFSSECLTPGIFLRRHFHLGVSHPESFSAAISIRVSHTRNLSPPPFHPDDSHLESFSATISTRMSHIRKFCPPDVPPSPDISHPESHFVNSFKSWCSNSPNCLILHP